MIGQGRSVLINIFVNQPEGRATGTFFTAKYPDQCFDQCGLTSAHCSMNRPDLGRCSLDEPMRDIRNLFFLIYYGFQGLSRCEYYKRDDHLFQRNPSMLIGVPVVADIMIEIIRIGEEKVVFGKNKRAAHGDAR